MNWEAVSAIGEILGSITVIGTIFYLAIQVRQAAAVAKGAAQQTAAQMGIDSIAITLDSQILSSASRKATIGEPLSPEELSNYIRWVWIRMRVAENVYYQYRQGLIDLEVWRSFVLLIVTHIGPGSVAEPHWERVSMSYSESFIIEVKRLLDAARIHAEDLPAVGSKELFAMMDKVIDPN